MMYSCKEHKLTLQLYDIGQKKFNRGLLMGTNKVTSCDNYSTPTILRADLHNNLASHTH